MPKDKDIRELIAAIEQRAESDVLIQLASESRPEDIGWLVVNRIASKHDTEAGWVMLAAAWDLWNIETEKLSQIEISLASLNKLKDTAYRDELANMMNALILNLSQAINRLELNEETIEDARVLICCIRGVYQRQKIQDQATFFNNSTAFIVNKALQILTGKTRSDNYQAVFDAAENLNKKVLEFGEEKKEEAVISPVVIHVNQQITTRKLNKVELIVLSKQLVATSNEALKKTQNNEIEQKKIEVEKQKLEQDLREWKTIIDSGRVISYDKLGVVQEFYPSLSDEKRRAWEQQATIDYRSKGATKNWLRTNASKLGGSYLAPVARKLPLGDQILGASGKASDVMADILEAGNQKLNQLTARLQELKKDDENCLQTMLSIPNENNAIQAKLALITDMKKLFFKLSEHYDKKFPILSELAIVFFKYADVTRNIQDYFELIIMICLKQDGVNFGFGNKANLGVTLRTLMNDPQFENLKKEFFDTKSVAYRDLRAFVAGSNNTKYFKASAKDDFSDIQSLLGFLELQEAAVVKAAADITALVDASEVKESEAHPPAEESKQFSPAQFQGAMFPPKVKTQEVSDPDFIINFIQPTVRVCNAYLDERRKQQAKGTFIPLISILRQSWAEDLIENLYKADKPQKVFELINSYLMKNLEESPDKNDLGSLHLSLVEHMAKLARPERSPPSP